MRASKPSSARCHTTSRVPTLDCLVVGGNLERVHEEDSLDVYRDSVSLTESMMSSGDNAHKIQAFSHYMHIGPLGSILEKRLAHESRTSTTRIKYTIRLI